MVEVKKKNGPIKNSMPKLNIYSLTGYTPDGLADEVFLVHEQSFTANEFQAMVIATTGKMQQAKDFEQATVHDVAQKLRDKFGFRRYSFTTCVIWDRERKVLCEASIRG
ncbi:hypothetical protein JXQ70_06210 [bacterium]|nr:hypothetical protein [bacterium]